MPKNNKMVKGPSFDPIEALKLTPKGFIAAHHKASPRESEFSVRAGYIYPSNHVRRGRSFGVDKKLYHATGCGFFIDGCLIGKARE